MPQDKNPIRRIVFGRPEEEIKSLAIALFDDPKTKPSDIGQRCFDLKFEEITKRGGTK
jgi:hypothetical protein